MQQNFFPKRWNLLGNTVTPYQNGGKGIGRKQNLPIGHEISLCRDKTNPVSPAGAPNRMAHTAGGRFGVFYCRIAGEKGGKCTQTTKEPQKKGEKAFHHIFLLLYILFIL